MKTAEIKVDQTYQGAGRNKDRLLEVVEVSTRKEREDALRAEDARRSRVESERNYTVFVREIGWSWGRGGLRLHETAEEKRTYWVRPQDISHEVDIDALVRETRENAERKAAAQAQAKAERPAAEERARRVNNLLHERGIRTGRFGVEEKYDGTSVGFVVRGEFTIGAIERLLGIEEE